MQTNHLQSSVIFSDALHPIQSTLLRPRSIRADNCMALGYGPHSTPSTRRRLRPYEGERGGHDREVFFFESDREVKDELLAVVADNHHWHTTVITLCCSAGSYRLYSFK